jgi:hypothetical protein
MYLLLGCASLPGMQNLSGLVMLYGLYHEAARYWHHTSRQ